MLRENWQFIARVERCADACIVVGAFFAAYYGRDALAALSLAAGLPLPFEGPELGPVGDYTVVLLLGVATFLVTLQTFGAYNSMRLSSVGQLARITGVSVATTFLILTSALFSIKVDVSRSFIILFCLTGGSFVFFERVAVLRFLRYWRRRGRNFRNVIICGLGSQARRIAEEIVRRPELGVGIACFATLRLPSETEVDKSLLAMAKDPHLRLGVEELVSCIDREAIDEVIFTEVQEVMKEVEIAVGFCAEVGVRTTLAADLFRVGMTRSSVSYFADVPLIHFQNAPGDSLGLTLKRAIDVVVSLALLTLLSPLLLGVALAILVVDGRPVLFKHKRVGLNGRLFSLYKFRSMHRDAEARQVELSDRNEMLGPAFKITDDPRVTKLGAWLRRFSIDELPQLWNVLRGDMSLVGPRPPVPGEVQLYERSVRRRLSMRPGLTCTWQVSGRNNIRDFQAWARLDLEYIDNWSLGKDLVLLVRTIPAVLFGYGAR